MRKFVQVLVVSFTIGMLASIGVASAEIYMIQFGGFDNSYWLNGAIPSGEERLDVLCNVGDKIIAGSVEIPGGTASIMQNRPIFDQGANSDQEGWRARIAGIQSQPSLSVWAHCLEPFSMAIGGSMLPTDNIALVLAYGIVNAVWMVPTVAGIGIGVYLVKRKIE